MKVILNVRLSSAMLGFCELVLNQYQSKAGFFKQATMDFWAVETTKWAVVNLNLGSFKIKSLKIWTKYSKHHLLEETDNNAVFHEILSE